MTLKEVARELKQRCADTAKTHNTVKKLRVKTTRVKQAILKKSFSR